MGPAERLHPGRGCRAAPSSRVCATARARSTPRTPATTGFTGRDPRSAGLRRRGARPRFWSTTCRDPMQIYERYAGVQGSAYIVGGVGMTALTANNIVLVPIRSGIGLRLGANIGYLKYTPRATWNPFSIRASFAAGCGFTLTRQWTNYRTAPSPTPRTRRRSTRTSTRSTSTTTPPVSTTKCSVWSATGWITASRSFASTTRTPSHPTSGRG